MHALLDLLNRYKNVHSNIKTVPVSNHHTMKTYWKMDVQLHLFVGLDPPSIVNSKICHDTKMCLKKNINNLNMMTIFLLQ